MDNNNDIYAQAGALAWQSVLQEVKNLCDSGMMQTAIGERLGRSKTLISSWLKKTKQAPNASYGDMLCYLDKLGLWSQDFLPEHMRVPDYADYQKELAQAHKRIEDLEKEMAALIAEKRGLEQAFGQALDRLAGKDEKKGRSFPEMDSDRQAAN